MRKPGATDLLTRARSALLDALEALDEHRPAVVLIGAQAIYLHTGQADVALAEATNDSDLALDTRLLADNPRVEQAMRAGGFYQSLAGGSGRRSVRTPPHDKNAARRAVGLEAAVVDHAPMEVHALAVGDARRYAVNVAGPAALLVAKLHKLGEREDRAPDRLNDKDARRVPAVRRRADRGSGGSDPVACSPSPSPLR